MLRKLVWSGLYAALTAAAAVAAKRVATGEEPPARR
jgi:hypothetical protein